MSTADIFQFIFLSPLIVLIAVPFLYSNLNLAFVLPNILFLIGFFSPTIFMFSFLFLLTFIFLIYNKDKSDMSLVLMLITLVFLGILNLAILVINGFTNVLIYLNNLLLLYAQFKIAIYISCRNDFKNKFGMTLEQAQKKIFKEKVGEFAFRFGLAQILNVFSFLFKPITDEFGHKFFGSTELRSDVEELKFLRDRVINYNVITLFTTVFLFFVYKHEELRTTSIKMSYAFIIDTVIGAIS